MQRLEKSVLVENTDGITGRNVLRDSKKSIHPDYLVEQGDL